jgi:hypothetical protein
MDRNICLYIYIYICICYKSLPFLERKYRTSVYASLSLDTDSRSSAANPITGMTLKVFLKSHFICDLY